MKKEQEFWQSFTDPVAVSNAIWAHQDKKISECLNMIVPHLKNRLKKSGGKVFDLGCGNGRLLYPFAKSYPWLAFTGIDFSRPMIENAMPNTNINYVLNDGATIPFPDNYFDCGYSMIMFQHIPNNNFADYLTEVGRVLRKGGLFRFQFVEGDQHHFLSHNALMSDVIEWVMDAGLKCTSFDTGIYDVWKWVTIQK